MKRIIPAVLLFPLLSCRGPEPERTETSFEELELLETDWGNPETLTPSAGVPETYLVAKGDSLFSISRKFGISIENIRRMNSLSTDVIYPGMMLSLKRQASQNSPETVIDDDFSLFEFDDSSSGGGSASAKKPGLTPRRVESAVSAKGYQWPLKGRILRRYNPGAGMNGILLSTLPGTPVACAKDGTVVFRGYVAGLGNTVVVRHAYDYLTVYGHLASVSVNCGDSLSRGDVIGTAGTSGNTPVAALHFRLYSDYSQTRNPVDFLP